MSPSLIRLPCCTCRRSTMPSKGALTLVKFNSACASSALALALSSLALYSGTSF